MRSAILVRLLTPVLGALVLGGQAFAQGLRSPANLDLDDIRGTVPAELVCEFRDPGAANLVLQGQEVNLLVTIKSSLTGTKYALKKAIQDFPSPSDDPSRDIRPVREPRFLRSDQDSVSYQRVDTYELLLKIGEDALPRDYQIKLTFTTGAEGSKDEDRYIRLFVGASAKHPFVNAAPAPATPVLSATDKSSLALDVTNNFQAYVLTLTFVEVTSEPAGLIKTLKSPRNDRILHGQTKRLEVPLEGSLTGWRRYWPVQRKPKLDVLLVYDDGYRSGLERMPRIPIEFVVDESPIVIGLIIAAAWLAGTVGGSWVRLLPGWRRSSWRTRGERIGASLLLGGVVIALIAVAKVEVLVQTTSWQWSLHSPGSVFLIAFVLALVDPTELASRIRKKFGLGEVRP